MSTRNAPDSGFTTARSLVAGAQAMGGSAGHVLGSGSAAAPSPAAGAQAMGGAAEHGAADAG